MEIETIIKGSIEDEIKVLFEAAVESYNSGKSYPKHFVIGGDPFWDQFAPSFKFTFTDDEAIALDKPKEIVVRGDDEWCTMCSLIRTNNLYGMISYITKNMRNEKKYLPYLRDFVSKHSQTKEEFHDSVSGILTQHAKHTTWINSCNSLYMIERILGGGVVGTIDKNNIHMLINSVTVTCGKEIEKQLSDHASYLETLTWWQKSKRKMKGVKWYERT